MKKIMAILLIALHSTPVFAQDDKQFISAMAFFYDEIEKDAGQTEMRYLVTPDFLRIDYGDADDDFILYDKSAEIIYSVNREDRTILFINKFLWKMPMFNFNRKIEINELKDAPTIAGKHLKTMHLKADDEICMDVQLIPNIYTDEMAVFKSYQNILSGQQSRMMKNTPKEMQTPCFLLAQIYNNGEYYDLGLPVQEWHARGYAKILKNYQKISVANSLFKLPESYRKYAAFVPE
ncbi:MAG: hypothetical protein OQL06_03595 [Gammaproteobacteria bacterium]|nr:hypothetical protein [Gammaproteobacteria bacterium]